MELTRLSLSHLDDEPHRLQHMTADQLDKLVSNIARNDHQVAAIVVRPHPTKPKRFIIVDGHSRVAAYRALKQKTSPATLWTLSEAQVPLVLATINALHGEEDYRQRALLVQELSATFSPEELATYLPESRQAIDDLLLVLQEQDDDLQKRINDQIAKEAASLPEILSFVLAKEKAERVRQALQERHTDPNEAIVLLCEESTAHA
jgi:ParB/RepB/Spo0J family partition protein